MVRPIYFVAILSAAENAEAALRGLIVARGYRPGERLPAERELSTLLGVSRPTVREAIGRLVRSGALEARHGSGTYVTAIDFPQVFEVRLQLEPFAAGRAAHSRSEVQVAAMRALLGELERTLGDPAAFSRADASLHALVAQASGNAVLVDVLRALDELAVLSRVVTSSEAELRSRTLEQLTGLVAAITDRDPRRASATMRRHLRMVQRRAVPPAG